MHNLYQLSNLLGRCGAKRRQHFTSIGFIYGPKQTKVIAGRCFRYLSEANNLRYLQIDVDRERTAEDWPPAMDLLKQVRVGQVEFLGEQPKVVDYLKAAMEMPKVENEGVPKKRKRASKKAAPKSEETVVEDEDQPQVPRKTTKKVNAAESRLGQRKVPVRVKRTKTAR